MPALRIVYVSDDIGRAETLTAEFASRDEALAAFAGAGGRALPVGALGRGARATDPLVVPMAGAAEAPARETRIAGLATAGAR